jgi:hypothetical protein
MTATATAIAANCNHPSACPRTNHSPMGQGQATAAACKYPHTNKVKTAWLSLTRVFIRWFLPL